MQISRPVWRQVNRPTCFTQANGFLWSHRSAPVRQFIRAVSTSVVFIQNATFYRQHPSSGDYGASNVLFEDISFELRQQQDAKLYSPDRWAIISPSSISRTSFLQIVGGQHHVEPPSARTYPALAAASISPYQAIKYVGFDADRGTGVSGTSLRGAYLSARYESRREETDFSVRDYLMGHTELNALEDSDEDVHMRAALERVVSSLNLQNLVDMPVANLSNGQTRRARIAKALMERPRILLLDGPFMGLDPRSQASVSLVLKALAQKGQPQLVISLRPEDKVPEWINNVVVIGHQNRILAQGDIASVLADKSVRSLSLSTRTSDPKDQPTRLSRDHFPKVSPALPKGEAVIEMNGVRVCYGSKTVLGDWVTTGGGCEKSGLWWSLHRGQRCGIFGPNGSGKTTMLSLITSDHPQAYSLPIKIFGRSRLPSAGEPGISVFDLQKRMGHSSPEVHAFFPRQLTVRRALESAWADAPLARPTLTELNKSSVDQFLAAFATELYPRAKDGTDWATETLFGELSFSSQRLLLFLRAIIAEPDLIILDEAFSGLDEPVRDKSFLFLAKGHAGLAVPGAETGGFSGLTATQALLVVSHAKEDVPGCVREWICLPDPGQGHHALTGTLPGPLELNPKGWQQIWSTEDTVI